MTTRVVHVKDQVPGAVYIGRANGRAKLRQSPWHNPHKIKDHAGDRNLAILQFANDLLNGEKRGMLAELPALRGRPLACWCRHDHEERHPGNTCHGDILVKLLELMTDDDLIALAQGETP